MHIRIIAEIGENHLGKMDLAKKMIHDAAVAGADIVKFQSYLGKDFKEDDPEKAWFHQVELSNEKHFELKKYADSEKIEFMSSPFSKERAQFLVETMGSKKVKIGSGVMLNFSILDFLNQAGMEEVILSTGLATLDEIRSALKHLNKVKKISILHCITQYPCSDSDANLLAIRKLQQSFPNYEIGYSDHTLGWDACYAAVAMGATIIEKHFTFDKNCKEGTDHTISLEPQELKELVSKVRRLETMMGKEEKNPTASELQIRDFVRGRFPS
jgi:N,N'-diacetyllegionaminate synthase